MYFLIWNSDDFGRRFRRAGHAEVRAKYVTAEEAIEQGDHDLNIGRHPLRVEDEEGNVLYEWKTAVTGS